MSGASGPIVVNVDADFDHAVDVAAVALEAGRVIGLVTDTVYGLAARADDHAAVQEIYEMKRRPLDRRMAVLVADPEQAAQLIDMTPAAIALTSAFWPGPLTLVAARTGSDAVGLDDDDSVGVRCPDEDVVRAIAARVGPLAASSANRHGQRTPSRAGEVAEMFPSVPVVLDGGERGGTASTVVSIVGDGLTVIRTGSLSQSRLREVLDADVS